MIPFNLPEITDDEIEKIINDCDVIAWMKECSLWHQNNLIFNYFTQHVVNELIKTADASFFLSNKNIKYDRMEYTIFELAENMREKYRPQVFEALKRRDVDHAIAGD